MANKKDKSSEKTISEILEASKYKAKLEQTKLFKNIIKYNELRGNISLIKDNKLKFLETKDFIKTNKVYKENLNKKISNIYREKIMIFFSILEKKLPYCDFSNLNENIRNLKVKKRGNFDLYVILFDIVDLPAPSSYYNIRKNQIVLDEAFEKDIMHELLHMASFKKTDSYDYHGLSIYDKKDHILIGNALTEGYTELLTKRYFNGENGSYYRETELASLLEIIVGKQTMERAYFNADLMKLLNELSKYNEIDNTIDFITNIDILMYFEDCYGYGLDGGYKSMNDDQQNKLQVLLSSISNYLINSYTNKLKIDIDSDIITVLEAKEFLYEFIRKIGCLTFVQLKSNNYIDSNLINKNVLSLENCRSNIITETSTKKM